MKKMNKKGFTIVELVIVIAVIAILAAVMIPTFSGVVTKAQQSAALQEVRSAYTATLADDLSNKATDTDVVNGKAVYVQYNGFYINVTADGKATIETGTATASASLIRVYVNAGKLQTTAPANNNG